MHYLLSGILYVSLFDSLQLFPLLALLACPGLASLFTCKDRLPKSDAPMPRASASARRQRLVTVYAKLYLMQGVWMTFMFIAPLCTLIALCYFIPSYWIYAVLLRQVDGPIETETGGAELVPGEVPELVHRLRV